MWCMPLGYLLVSQPIENIVDFFFLGNIFFQAKQFKIIKLKCSPFGYVSQYFSVVALN